METTHLEEIAAFIREHRSNESNFDKLYAKLEEEIGDKNATDNYVNLLRGIKQKAAEPYLTAKKTSGFAWPEFEKFASEFEKAVIDAK